MRFERVGSLNLRKLHPDQHWQKVQKKNHINITNEKY